MPAFIDLSAIFEPVQCQQAVNFMRAVMGNSMGKTPARARNSLKAAITPASIQIKPVNICFGNKGRSIHRHIHNAGPLPQNLYPPQCRHHIHRTSCNIIINWQIAALGIGIMAVQIPAKYHSALVRLANIKMAMIGRIYHNSIQKRLDRLGYKGLQFMAFDRQFAQPGHFCQKRG